MEPYQNLGWWEEESAGWGALENILKDLGSKQNLLVF